MQKSRASLQQKESGEVVKASLVAYITRQTEIDKFNALANPSSFEYDNKTFNIIDVNRYQKHLEIYA